jgi:hypothetical protein
MYLHILQENHKQYNFKHIIIYWGSGPQKTSEIKSSMALYENAS